MAVHMLGMLYACTRVLTTCGSMHAYMCETGGLWYVCFCMTPKECSRTDHALCMHTCLYYVCSMHACVRELDEWRHYAYLPNVNDRLTSVHTGRWNLAGFNINYGVL